MGHELWGVADVSMTAAAPAVSSVVGERQCLWPLPAALDFGAVPLGEYADLEVRLQNVCPVAIAVTVPSAEAAFLVVGGMDRRELSPGEAFRATVRFRPLWAGLHEHGLRVDSEAWHPTFVALRGEAVKP